MNPANFDPNHPPPEVSSGDCWDDAEALEHSGLPAPTILPPRRTLADRPTTPATEVASGGPETGLRIESNLIRRDASEDLQPLEVQEFNSPVVRLEQPSPAPPKVARLTKFIERGNRDPASQNPNGEGQEWGRTQRQSILWILGVGGGVIALVIAAMMMLPGINRANAAREVPAERSFKVINEEVIEGIDALNRMFEKQPEAELIFRAYGRATVVDEVLPLVRDGQGLKETIRREWKAAGIPENWAPPKEFSWQVIKSGNHYCGILEGTLPDFSKFHAYFVNEGDRLLMDWKATSGYGTASFDDMSQGTGDTREIRGTLIPSNFHTSTWPEADYLSYQLVSPSGESAIWCYAKRRGPSAGRITGLFQSGEILQEPEGPKKVTLRLEPGPTGRFPNQWLIAELLHTDWTAP